MAEAPPAAAPTPEPARTEDAVIKPAASELTAEELAEPDEVRIARALKLKEDGNARFAAGEIEPAIDLYAEAIRISPPACADRVMFFSNRALCYLKKANYDSCVKDCTSALEISPSHVKSLQRRAMAYEQLKKYKEAQEDWEAVLKHDANNSLAKAELAAIPGKAARYEEDQKAEAMAKLKEIGNSFLGLFGMSTDNFKVVQDPKSGGYSISIQK